MAKHVRQHKNSIIPAIVFWLAFLVWVILAYLAMSNVLH